MNKKISSYIDPTGEFTNKELEMSTWYISHRARLRMALIIFLSSVATLTLGYSLIYLGYYAVIGYWSDQDHRDRQLQQIQSFPMGQVLYQADNLQIDSTTIFRGAPGKYDFVSNMQNPNEQMIANVSYHYRFANGRTATRQEVILPKGNQLAAVLGYSSDFYPTAVELVIENVAWKQIDPHRIPDPPRFVQERLVIQSDALAFERANDLIPASRIFFDVHNETVYGLRSANFYVRLFNRGELVGVLPLTIDRLRGEDIRSVELRTLRDLSRVTDIDLLPRVNIFDQQVFLPVGT